ncbi:MAG TPA: tRNA (N(6)-L-threonylcarbamoyladenosine(37)-C(2))-methylthiotransferase MtaB [Candidatus Limnocylindrales bacterium]|nr:tRNA (N(6)-L-threonylcarbamoyladenosine(37)-C(2))-methylthiotransferase MtaB [Candidatus Limnocylindrales bacterium]
MATFSIENFGCRATDADAALLRQQLLSAGLAQRSEHSDADVVVLNTCTVTAAADAQAREAVRKIHRKNPNARIIVTGCYAQRAPEEIAAIPGVACVVGNSHQEQIPSLALSLDGGAASSTLATENDFIPMVRLDRNSISLAHGPAKILSGDILAHRTLMGAPSSPVLDDHTRRILKIQDGCDNRCSYCVIPFVRGGSRSLPPEDVLNRIQTLIDSGAREIVLSGINLGTYGRDLAERPTLEGLVQRILAETNLEQLRFSSIEPQDITEIFLSLAASSTRIAPHFHVPLQSGSDAILRAMRRWYRAAHYAQRIKLIREMMPNAAIGADVIVGFPGETEGDFSATLELAQALPFTYLHVFSFSERPGTAAEKLGSRVPPVVIRERARALRAAGEAKSISFRATQAARTVRALTLNRRGENWTEALTGNYLKVRVGGLHRSNQWHSVSITSSPTQLTAAAPA